MSDLIDFLRARLDEDEQVACATGGRWWQPPAQPTEVLDSIGGGFNTFLRSRAAHIARNDPTRVLAEVEAKRRIIRAHSKWCQGDCETADARLVPDAHLYWTIKVHAEAYADHPEYDQAWRP